MPQHRYRQSGQFKIYARVVRSCLSLSEDERLVLLFLLDRSVERGRSFAVLSLKELDVGIIRKKASKRVMVVQGTGLSPERVTTAIDALRGIGAITTYRQDANLSCHINEDWLHPDLPQQGQFALWGLNENDYIYPNCEDGE